VRVDDGLGDVAYLDMAVFGRDAPAVTRPAQGDGEALGRHSDLLPPGQSVLELCDLRLQLRRPGSWPPSSKTKPISVGGGCETMRHLDDVTSADTGRRPIGNPGAQASLETVAVGGGIGPAACLLSYGTWATADPRSRSSSCLQHTQSAIEACTH
jgi:hypothetical protein